MRRGLLPTLANAIRAGAGGLITTRADSAFYNTAVIAAIRRAGARFSITARMDAGVRAAIGRIDEDAWGAGRLGWVFGDFHPGG